MTATSYTSDRTGLLLVDPHDDFLSESGKFWPMIKGVNNDVGLLNNLRTITAAIRKAGIRVFIVPHCRWESGDYEGWDHPTPYQMASGQAQAFAKDSWGGEWHPDFAPHAGDIVVKEDSGSSGLRTPTSICA